MEKTSFSTSHTRGRLGFPYKGGIHYLSPEQIIRLEAESNYTFIFIDQQKPIIMAKVLADYEAMLAPFGFLRTHRSHLINTHHIQSIDKAGRIVMDDSSEAEISRRKRKQVLEVLNLPQAA